MNDSLTGDAVVAGLLARVLDLEEAIARHLALENIRRLRERYCLYVDAKRWGELESILTPDYQHFATNTVNAAPSLVADGVKAYLQRVLEVTEGATTVHVCSMPDITLTSTTTATGLWAMTDVVSHPTEPGLRFSGRGHYRDDYRRGDDGTWRIAVTRLSRQRLDSLPLRESDGSPRLPSPEDRQ
jgi:SnoaL-like domain